jgi:nucleoside-diphosphate-sugar epimerase
VCDPAAVGRLVAGADCVWHNAAAVGPFHPRDLYFKVNYEGTLVVIRACKEAGVKKIVMSSSPSTRFDGSDVDGLSEAQLPPLPQPRYLQTYAETKAMGEKALTDACCPELMTCAVAPHQVYGPRDNLFLPNLLEAAGSGRLRVFGKGLNRICFTYVDNYAHGLIIAERALVPGGKALGQFYIVTDGATHPFAEGYLLFWDILEEASLHMGFSSIKNRVSLPMWLLWLLASVCEAITWLLGITLKLSYFNVKMLTMHRWFTINKAEEDLGYKPIVSFADGWGDTLVWFKSNWLPSFDPNAGLTGLAKGTEDKIATQVSGMAGGSKKAD